MERWTRARLDSVFRPVRVLDTTPGAAHRTADLNRTSPRKTIVYIQAWVDGEHQLFDLRRPLDVGTYLTLMVTADFRRLLRPGPS